LLHKLTLKHPFQLDFALHMHSTSRNDIQP
jgi:hypothetical protein